MSIFSEALIGIRLALRANFFWLSASSFLILTLAALMVAQFSARQPATVALDVGFSIIRMVLPLMIVLFVQELLSREFDRRYYLNSLSYPRQRLSFLLGRFSAVFALVAGQLLVLSLLLSALVWFIGEGYAQATPVVLDHHYLISLAFIIIDLLVLAALATFLAVVASTPSFVLIGTFGFMLVARSFGAIVELLNRDATLVGNAESYRANLGLLGYLLPDLGVLDMRAIVLYGKLEFLPADWPWLVLNSIAYAVGLLALAAWALQRKRFA